MTTSFVILLLFIIKQSASQTVAYQDISCNSAYSATFLSNNSVFFRFSVPINSTNAVQISLCNATFDSVLEVYKYTNDSIDSYNNGYIGRNDDFSNNDCPASSSNTASYFQLSPFTYTDIANYSGYYILKLYDLSNYGSMYADSINNYTLLFTCNQIKTTLPVSGELNCIDKTKIFDSLNDGEWKLYKVYPPQSFARANFSFTPGFTLDSCKTNFYADYQLIAYDLQLADYMDYIDSMCTSQQTTDGGDYLTFTTSDPVINYYYLNISAQYTQGRFEIDYICDIIPTNMPTQAPTILAGTIACGESIIGTINNIETYSYSFDLPLYANYSQSVTFIDCDSNGNDEISMSVFAPNNNNEFYSDYEDYYSYCGSHTSVAVLQLNPDRQSNNATNWHLQVSKSNDYLAQSAVSYNITYVCRNIDPPTPSPTAFGYTYAPTITPQFNFTFPFNITGNITECGQELSGVLNSYYNDTTPAIYALYLMKFSNRISKFTIDPCNTQYPVDIHVISATSMYNSDWEHYLPPIKTITECSNGYNSLISFAPDQAIYGTDYIIGWIGTNKSSDETIFEQTDGSYSVVFDCSGVGLPSRTPTVEGYTYPPTETPLKVPSHAPTVEGYTYGPTKSPANTDASGESGKESNKSGLDVVPSYVWLILVIVLAILCVIFLVLWCRKKKEMNAVSEQIQISSGSPYVQLTDENDNTKL